MSLFESFIGTFPPSPLSEDGFEVNFLVNLLPFENFLTDSTQCLFPDLFVEIHFGVSP